MRDSTIDDRLATQRNERKENDTVVLGEGNNISNSARGKVKFPETTTQVEGLEKGLARTTIRISHPKEMSAKPVEVKLEKFISTDEGDDRKHDINLSERSQLSLNARQSTLVVRQKLRPLLWISEAHRKQNLNLKNSTPFETTKLTIPSMRVKLVETVNGTSGNLFVLKNYQKETFIELAEKEKPTTIRPRITRIKYQFSGESVTKQTLAVEEKSSVLPVSESDEEINGEVTSDETSLEQDEDDVTLEESSIELDNDEIDPEEEEDLSTEIERGDIDAPANKQHTIDQSGVEEAAEKSNTKGRGRINFLSSSSTEKNTKPLEIIEKDLPRNEDASGINTHHDVVQNGRFRSTLNNRLKPKIKSYSSEPEKTQMQISNLNIPASTTKTVNHIPTRKSHLQNPSRGNLRYQVADKEEQVTFVPSRITRRKYEFTGENVNHQTLVEQKPFVVPDSQSDEEMNDQVTSGESSLEQVEDVDTADVTMEKTSIELDNEEIQSEEDLSTEIESEDVNAPTAGPQEPAHKVREKTKFSFSIERHEKSRHVEGKKLPKNEVTSRIINTNRDFVQNGRSHRLRPNLTSSVLNIQEAQKTQTLSDQKQAVPENRKQENIPSSTAGSQIPTRKSNLRNPHQRGNIRYQGADKEQVPSVSSSITRIKNQFTVENANKQVIGHHEKSSETESLKQIPNEKSIKQVDADEEIRVDTTRGYWARNKNPVFHPRAKEILIQPGKDLPREPEIFNNRNRHVLLNTRPQGKLYSNILRPKLTSS